VHISILKVINVKLARAGSQVPLLEEVPSELSSSMWTINDVSDTEHSEVELPSVDEKRVSYVFLNNELSHWIQEILSSRSLNKISYLIDLAENLDSTTAVRIFARLHNPYT
jgi:hypothetical protein